MNLSVLSTEYVRVQVNALVGGENYNPTGDSVAFAFVQGPPTNPTWITGAWDAGGPPYVAKCLVGPGSPNHLPVGTYSIWVKVSDNPETPIQRAGTLNIY